MQDPPTLRLHGDSRCSEAQGDERIVEQGDFVTVHGLSAGQAHDDLDYE